MRLEPESLEIPEKRLVALSHDYTIETRAAIPELWNDFWAKEWQFKGIEERRLRSFLLCAAGWSLLICCWQEHRSRARTPAWGAINQ
jgi:hypothetical protein